MAIFKRLAWKVMQNNQIRDVVFFPASYDAKTVKRVLIKHYGYTGSFEVELR